MKNAKLNVLLFDLIHHVANRTHTPVVSLPLPLGHGSPGTPCSSSPRLGSWVGTDHRIAAQQKESTGGCGSRCARNQFQKNSKPHEPSLAPTSSVEEPQGQRPYLSIHTHKFRARRTTTRTQQAADTTVTNSWGLHGWYCFEGIAESSISSTCPRCFVLRATTLSSSTEYPAPSSIMPADLLHPTSSHEKRVHKLKRLVQSPNRCAERKSSGGAAPSYGLGDMNGLGAF